MINYVLVSVLDCSNSPNYKYLESLTSIILIACCHNTSIYHEEPLFIVMGCVLKAVENMFIKLMSTEKYKDSTQKNKLN